MHRWKKLRFLSHFLILNEYISIAKRIAVLNLRRNVSYSDSRFWQTADEMKQSMFSLQLFPIAVRPRNSFLISWSKMEELVACCINFLFLVSWYFLTPKSLERFFVFIDSCFIYFMSARYFSCCFELSDDTNARLQNTVCQLMKCWIYYFSLYKYKYPWYKYFKKNLIRDLF